MPVIKRLALVQKPVGAGPGHPIGNIGQVRGRQNHAFGHQCLADVVLAAAAGFVIQQAAGHPGQFHFTRIGIFKLVQTAFPAPVAQRLPLALSEVLERHFLPKAVTQTVAVDRVGGHRQERSGLLGEGKRCREFSSGSDRSERE